MKIGIITLSDYTNYGNRLQNYAVSYVLQKRFNCKAVSLETNCQKKYYNHNFRLWCKEHIAKWCCLFPEFAEKHFGNDITRSRNFYKWSKKIHTKSNE